MQIFRPEANNNWCTKLLSGGKIDAPLPSTKLTYSFHIQNSYTCKKQTQTQAHKIKRMAKQTRLLISFHNQNSYIYAREKKTHTHKPKHIKIKGMA
jgi:hypothetical protein